MRRAWWIAVGLLLGATTSGAGSYTVTTSTAEDTALQADLDTDVNPRRASRGAAPWTLAEYVQHLLDLNVRPIREAAQAREAITACEAYRTLSDADRQTVRSLLGGSPCR